MRYEIHISDIRTFKSCRRKWNWSSPLRANLEPNVPYAPFFTGRAIHYSLEQFYSPAHTPLLESLNTFLAIEKDEMERVGKLWPQESELIAEQIVLLAGMLEHYTQWVEQDTSKWSDPNLDYWKLETQFSVPLRTPSGRPSPRVYLAGRFDGIVRRKDDGSYWLLENKTTRSISELVTSLDNDEQAGAYLIAAKELLAVQPLGVLYNIMRKKIPTEPMILQSGLLSQNKQMDTTAYAYIRAAQKLHMPDFNGDVPSCNHFIMEQYGTFIQHLLDQGNRFFLRVPIYRTEREMDQLQHDLWTVALEMTRFSTPIYPAPSWTNCKFCHFRSPCLAMNSGADYGIMLDNEYREREPWQTFAEIEEEVTNGKTNGPA
jgi:hypothetical protein